MCRKGQLSSLHYRDPRCSDFILPNCQGCVLMAEHIWSVLRRVHTLSLCVVLLARSMPLIAKGDRELNQRQGGENGRRGGWRKCFIVTTFIKVERRVVISYHIFTGEMISLSFSFFRGNWHENRAENKGGKELCIRGSKWYQIRQITQGAPATPPSNHVS